jgi:parvulin-like peptidyl-prolyl isomerase
MRRIIFVFIGILIAVCGYSQADLQPAATVNLIRTEAITVRQLRTEVTRMEQASRRALTHAERLQVLDAMINERLVLQAAERDRVIVTDNELNNQLQQVRNSLAQQMGRQPTDAEFAQAIQNQSGLEFNAYREQLRRQMISQKYLITRKGDMINSVRPPTEEEIRSEFNLRRADFVRPETVEFVAIQIPFGSDAASRNSARQRGEQLIREIGSNVAIFDRKVDEAVMPNSGYNAGPGSLPRIPEAQAQFGQEFINVAFNLRQGQVSRLIETPTSYLIIKVTRNLEFKALELEDIVPSHILAQAGADPRMNITVRNFFGQLLAMQRQQRVIMQATQELISELRTNRTFQVFENNIRW